MPAADAGLPRRQLKDRHIHPAVTAAQILIPFTAKRCQQTGIHGVAATMVQISKTVISTPDGPCRRSDTPACSPEFREAVIARMLPCGQ